jgi:hypothetical protein
MRKRDINFCEIGIENGASLQMWRDYFCNAHIYAMELYDHKIQDCMNLDLKDVHIYKMDASDVNNINAVFGETNKLFDVIIDDSSHILQHQNNIINTVSKYISSGGILIIEDIDREVSIDNYYIDSKEWSFSTFIICHHDNRLCSDNDKILFLIKS